MKKRLIRELKKTLREICRTAPVVLLECLLLIVVVILLWVTTEWQVQDVAFVAVMSICLGTCGIQIVVAIRRERVRTRIIERRRYEQKRRDSFRDIMIKGEFIEVEVPGTDLVEIRHVVAKE